MTDGAEIFDHHLFDLPRMVMGRGRPYRPEALPQDQLPD